MVSGPDTNTDLGSFDRPPSIDGYGGGSFRIDGVVHTGSLIVFPARAIAWDVATFAEVTHETMPPALFGDDRIELLLLGCGDRMQFLPKDLREALRATGTGIEPMDTGAAVRTYNILLGENRRVAAALIAVD